MKHLEERLKSLVHEMKGNLQLVLAGGQGRQAWHGSGSHGCGQTGRGAVHPRSMQHNGKFAEVSLSDRHTGESLLTGKRFLGNSLLLSPHPVSRSGCGLGSALERERFIHLYRMDRERQAYLERIKSRWSREEPGALGRDPRRVASDQKAAEKFGKKRIRSSLKDLTNYKIGLNNQGKG